MYRRLIMFGLAVCAAALLALLIPLGLAARDIVQSQQLSAAAGTARAVADQWQQAGRSHGEPIIAIPDTQQPGAITLYSPRGQIEGLTRRPRSTPWRRQSAADPSPTSSMAAAT